MPTCSKCQKESENHRGALVWLETSGATLVSICPECYAECAKATEKAFPELVKKDEVQPAPTHPEPRWHEGNYRMNEAEIHSFKELFTTKYAEVTGLVPDSISVMPMYANTCYKDDKHFRVSCADVTIDEMTITMAHKHRARDVLVSIRMPVR